VTAASRSGSPTEERHTAPGGWTGDAFLAEVRYKRAVMRGSPQVIAVAVAALLAAGSPAHADVLDVAVDGYLETFYSINFGLPSNRITNLRGFDNRERTLTLANVALGTTARRGPLTARLVLQVGSTPSTYYLAEPRHPGTAAVNGSDAELWKYVQQATFAYTTSAGVVAEAGLFLSPIGPESIAVKDSWNWSRSNLFFGLPFYHTGARTTVPLGQGWTATAHVYSGWNSVVDNNAYPSVGASAAYASERVNAQALYLGGVERASGAAEGQPWRHLFDAFATVAVTDHVSVRVHGDAGFERNRFGRSGWATGAAYAMAQLTRRTYGAVRADYFREWVAAGAGARAAAVFWPTPWLSSLTATVAHQPASGLSLRLELRHDQAASRVFFGGDVAGDGVLVPYEPNRRAQQTVTLGATAWF
jgi:hypothetical protein